VGPEDPIESRLNNIALTLFFTDHLYIVGSIALVFNRPSSDFIFVDFALGPHLEEKTCDRFRLKTIIRLSVVLVRCQHLQNILVQ